MAETFQLADLQLPADSDIPALLAACPDIAPLRFKDQEIIIHGGGQNLDLFLLLKGCCLVEQPDAPEKRRPGFELAILEPMPGAPVFVGEMAYLGQTDRTALVRSAMNTWVLRLQPAHLDAIIENFPKLTATLCRQFAKRLRETNQNLHCHQQLTALDREQIILEPGDILIEAGAPAERLYQLVDGTLFREPDTDITALPGSPHRPCFIAPAAYFRGQPHTDTVRAKTAAILLAYNQQDKTKVVRNFPEAILELLGE